MGQSPRSGQMGGQVGQSALGPHLSFGVSSIWLSLTHGSSSLFKLITATQGPGKE